MQRLIILHLESRYAHFLKIYLEHLIFLQHVLLDLDLILLAIVPIYAPLEFKREIFLFILVEEAKAAEEDIHFGFEYDSIIVGVTHVEVIALFYFSETFPTLRLQGSRD